LKAERVPEKPPTEKGQGEGALAPVLKSMYYISLNRVFASCIPPALNYTSMDPVTHGLTGIFLSNLFPGKKKLSLLVLFFASMAPDIDYITRIGGLDVFLRYHRGITHGILALFVVSILTGIIVRWFTGKGFLYPALLAFFGYGVHLLMDLTNQYPTRILSPLDWTGYSLDLTFIISPYVTGGVLLGIVLTLRKRSRKVLVTLTISLLLLVYFGTRFYLKGAAEEFLRTKLDEYHYHLSPLPNDFLRWWFVTRSGDGYKTGVVDLFTKRVYLHDRLIYSETEPEIRESKQLRTVRNFLYFSRFPYPEIRKTGGETIVTWRELGYAYIPGDHFIARIRFDRLGRAVEEYFRF
jgi:inner membrane protein